ncbi:major facilitator superfamily transporter [Delitschia confertaspora ATCC 74209]|uniref:Major facilitator superfamily transporter n=1 Tax=Delitschia confertaspora ATCC 74209 TaxID=1513339 RepID=A0A9P4JCU2_9PLEO|nr:major facilitator superfamily transporter [Delitschia confertaspora ATCC 74209]
MDSRSPLHYSTNKGNIQFVEKEALQDVIELPESFEEGQRSVPDIQQDGGLTGWLQAFACWLLFMNTWGLTNSFGIFETYYTHTLLPSVNPSSISWIGSLQLFLTLFIGVFAGWLLDAGHIRAVVITGIVLEGFGMFMTSLCTRYWQLLLAQGACVGIGSGTLAFTSAAVIPFYFTKRRMFAAGIVSTGSSVAGVVYPFMMRELIQRVGFAWAVRILAFVITATLLVSLVTLKPHTAMKKHAPLFQMRLLRDTPYTLFILAYAFMVAGVYVPYFYIQNYALDLGIDDDMTFNIVSIMNAATFFGRFPYNYLADSYGGISVLVPCCFATAIVLFLWRFVHTVAGLIVISAIYCFVTGGLVSLPAATIANLTVNKAEYRTRMGMGYTVAAIGALIGNPIAGVAKRRGHGSYEGLEEVMLKWQGAWLFAGGCLAVATTLMVWARLVRGGLDFKIKL